MAGGGSGRRHHQEPDGRTALVGRQDRQTKCHCARQRPLRHRQVGKRQYVTNVSKARELSGSDLSRINDPYTVMSLRLQAAFGLRCGQWIKIRPEWADRGNHLALQDTWTQGGRARRELPIPNSEQRQVLNEAKLLAGRGSLIPVDRSYVDQLRRFEHQCAAAGVHRIHGHRHRMRRFGTGNSPNGRHRQPVDRSQRI